MSKEFHLQMVHRLLDPFDDGLGSVEFAHVEEEKPVPILSSEKKFICELCAIAMVPAPSGGMRCEKCGFVDDSEAFELDVGNECMAEQYNTSENSSMATRVIGPGRSGQRVLHSSPSANGTKNIQHRDTVNKILTLVQRKDSSISQKVISDAADLFCQVQQHRVLRGGVRKGTQAACLYRVCAPNRISRSIREIAQLFEVDQSEVSNGDKILDELYSKGLITKTFHDEDQTEDMQVSDLLARYFNSLEMTERCRSAGLDLTNLRNFCTRLVRFTKAYRIAEGSVINSKCIGSIYVMSQQIPALKIDWRTIEAKCKISKSTFNRFGKSISMELNSTEPTRAHVRSRLRQVFRSHSIPLGELGVARDKRIKKPAAAPKVTEKSAPIKPSTSREVSEKSREKEDDLDILDQPMTAD